MAVIARGSSFRFRQAATDLDVVATALAARYVLSGIVESQKGKVTVILELTDTSTHEILWADRLATCADGIDDLRGQIVAHLIAALETNLKPLLLGQDATRIEYIWQDIFRGTFWRGGPVLQSALAISTFFERRSGSISLIEF